VGKKKNDGGGLGVGGGGGGGVEGGGVWGGGWGGVGVVVGGVLKIPCKGVKHKRSKKKNIDKASTRKMKKKRTEGLGGEIESIPVVFRCHLKKAGPQRPSSARKKWDNPHGTEIACDKRKNLKKCLMNDSTLK